MKVKLDHGKKKWLLGVVGRFGRQQLIFFFYPERKQCLLKAHHEN